MSTRYKGPGAGFGWLKHGISVGYRYPKPLFGGAALLAIACLLPSAVTLPLEFVLLKRGATPGLPIFAAIMAVSMLSGLLLVPLYAGYMQMIHAVDHGLPARAFDLFGPYRRGEAWRLFGYGLIMLLVYVVLFGIVIAATGGSFVRWNLRILAAQANHQPPPTTLPEGFGVTISLFILAGFFIMGLYSIGFGQVAINRRRIFAAIFDGLTGALKNLLPLIVFALSTALAFIALTIAMAILVLLFVLLGKLVGPWIVIALMVPVYIAFILVTLAAMFGAMYYLWRDVCGTDAAPVVNQDIAA